MAVLALKDSGVALKNLKSAYLLEAGHHWNALVPVEGELDQMAIRLGYSSLVVAARLVNVPAMTKGFGEVL